MTQMANTQELYDQILYDLQYTESLATESDVGDMETISLESEYDNSLISADNDDNDDHKNTNPITSSISFSENVRNFSHITSSGSDRTVSYLWFVSLFSLIVHYN